MDDVYKPLAGYPAAVRCGRFLFLSGQIAWDPRKGLIKGFRDLGDDGRRQASKHAYLEAIEGPVAAQTWFIYENLRRVLEAEGSGINQMLRAHIYQKNKRFFPAFERVRMQFEAAGAAPSSGLGVSRLQRSAEAWIDFDAIALIPDEHVRSREIVAGADVLPSSSFYSQAVQAGPYLFLAGHIPVHTGRPGNPVIQGYDDVPEEGRFLKTGRSHPDGRDGPIAAQTWFTYNEIGKLLRANGCTFKDVVNLTVYLQSMNDLPTFHRVHERLFPDDPPALTVVEFAEVGSRGTRVEIEATAVVPGAGVVRRAVRVPNAAPGLHAPSAVEAGPLLFLSGAVGWGVDGPIRSMTELAPDKRKIAERIGRQRTLAAAQAWAALDSMRRTMAHMALSLNDLAKVTVYLKDLEDFETIDSMREAFEWTELPALSLVQIPRPGPTADDLLCVEAVAWRGATGDS